MEEDTWPTRETRVIHGDEQDSGRKRVGEEVIVLFWTHLDKMPVKHLSGEIT